VPDGFLNVASGADRVARCPLPSAYHLSMVFFAEIGGLLSYGNDQRDLFQLAATPPSVCASGSSK